MAEVYMGEKKVIIRNEAQLQGRCVMWYHNNHLEDSSRLWATMNEGQYAATKLAMGMKPGVPDLLYYSAEPLLYGLELKFPGAAHTVAHILKQAEWMCQVVPGRGWFIDSFEDFEAFFEGREMEHALRAEEVRDFLRGPWRGVSVTWGEEFRNRVRYGVG